MPLGFNCRLRILFWAQPAWKPFLNKRNREPQSSLWGMWALPQSLAIGPELALSDPETLHDSAGGIKNLSSLDVSGIVIRAVGTTPLASRSSETNSQVKGAREAQRARAPASAVRVAVSP